MYLNISKPSHSLSCLCTFLHGLRIVEDRCPNECQHWILNKPLLGCACQSLVCQAGELKHCVNCGLSASVHSTQNLNLCYETTPRQCSIIFCLISCLSHRHTSNHFLCYRNGLTYSNLWCDYLPGHFLRSYYFSATSQPLLVIHSGHSSSIQHITEQQSCGCKALYTTRVLNLKVGFQQCQYPLGCARKKYHASHL